MIERARRLAGEFSCRFAPRRRETLAGLRRKYADARDGVLVAGADGLRFVAGDAPPLFYHPSMAFIRVKRLRDGGTDALVEAANAKEGDAVLDCTAGLGADSLVLSYAVGEKGRVTALEASRLLHVIVREGLREYDSELADVNAAMRRIDAVCADHLEYMSAMPDKSVDIVYFDPMFTVPVEAASSLAPLRAYAKDEPLAEEALRQARRVARKRIVLKEHRESGQFARLGIRLVRPSGAAIAYGVISIHDEND
nr:class I SAM-dependent methyltransferase [Cohnella algarum]